MCCPNRMAVSCFFTQKTAYEIRPRDWSSDVCSSDLCRPGLNASCKAGWECNEMNHLSEEQIVLHYYGDADGASEIERHLATCGECRAEFTRMESMLQQIEPIKVPEPAANFEEKTWLRLRDRLPEKSGFFRKLFGSQQKWALAGVMA